MLQPATRARHRRSRGRDRGRHKGGLGLARWAIPAGLAVMIAFLVAAALLVSDMVTSTAVPLSH